MADIREIGPVSDSRPAAAPRGGRTGDAPGRPENPAHARPSDSISLSDEARLASRHQSIEGKPALTSDLNLRGTQADNASRVRAELDAGVYVTNEKLDIAVERLIDDVLGS